MDPVVYSVLGKDNRHPVMDKPDRGNGISGQDYKVRKSVFDMIQSCEGRIPRRTEPQG